MNVLSLFDGMSCGQIALDQLGIKVDNYYAAEIDKYAMQIAKKNYPNTMHLGDVTSVYAQHLPKIDLLMGGSPCQGFSFAGKQLNFDDPRSALFFEFVRLLKECKPKYFLLENVRMKKEYQDIISEHLGVEPIMINSALVSAQNRVRLYWTNIPNITQPDDKNIVLKDILENGIATDEMTTNKKSFCLTARYQGAVAWNSIERRQRTMVQVGIANDINGHDILTQDTMYYRKLTPLECERLQTVPDGYTEGVSNTQRYKMLGNGWTVEVIKHILKEMI
jgi:site-specific DNA-cytosine methylase